MTAFALPFLTLPDPAISAEGALDPLGLATTGDRLANGILPGLTSRMSRPRFLTAIAVAAVVCDDLEAYLAADHVTPAHLVFEWLLVEGFARKGNNETIKRTPGIDKARAAVNAQSLMCARAYLKTPSVFGFHGVYSRLARNLGIVDDDFRLRDNGYTLVKIWQEEQGVGRFLPSALSTGGTTGMRQVLRWAVEEGLKEGYTRRSATWQGWSFFAEHLAPSKIGSREAAFIHALIVDGGGDKREEVFRLVEQPDTLAFAAAASESLLVQYILTQASEELARRLKTIIAYERLCLLAERGFDWLRYLSSQSGACALSRGEFAANVEIRKVTDELPHRLQSAYQAIDDASLAAQNEFYDLAAFFNQVNSGDDLYDALLNRHAQVQKNKKPDGKREWFERASDSSIFVRLPYRLDEPPRQRDHWARPYRLHTVRSFCEDFRSATL